MESYTLVVVDMQPDFEASNNPATIANVKREIIEAKAKQMPILFLEVPYFSPLDERGLRHTHQELTQLVKFYPNTTRYPIEKLRSDGSYQVLWACEQNHYTNSHFRICGVNTNICVYETAVGLSQNGVVEVIKNACNTTTPMYDFNDFKNKTNIFFA